jgi:photosystem II stability/assembly factor-like uncharacterized protein
MSAYYHYFIVALILLTGFSGSVSGLKAQSDMRWTWANSKPMALEATDFYFTDANNGWLISANGVISRTRNGGQTWIDEFHGNWPALYGIDFSGEQTGFIVGGAGKILKTTDGGESWQITDSGFENTLRKIQMVSPAVGYILGDQGTFLKTVDGGQTWNIIGVDGQLQLSLMHFADPQNGLVIGLNNGIYITNDGGETWTRKEPEGSYRYQTAYMISPDNLVVTTYQQLNTFSEGILVTSVDGGDSWNMEWTGAYVTNSIGFESPEVGYVFFNYARYRTSDGGKNWTKQLIGSDKYAGIIHPPGAWYADGVWFFRDNAGYVYKNENLETGSATLIRSPDFSRFNYITRHTTGLYLLSNNRIYRSRDDGNTYSQVYNSTANVDSRNRIHFVSNNAGFGVFLRSQIRSQSAGDSWQVVTAFIQHEARSFMFSDLIYIDQQTAYAVGADAGLYKREPMFGWYQLQPPAGNVYRVITADGNRVWAGGDEGNFIYSTDGGMNWDQLELPVNAQIREIYRPFGEQIWLLTNVPGLIIKSEDGIHFTLVETGYNVVINSLLIEDQLTMTAVGDQSHILTSTDGGETWVRENAVTDKYPSRYDLLSVVRLASGGMKAVGTNGAILHRSADLTSIEPGMDKPDRVSLYQNYPNPFNPKTTIFYRLNQPGAVRIDVYNSIGQLVTAFDKGMQNQGGHSLIFNGTGLPSGLYLYRLSVNGQLAGTRKMLLVK